MGQADRVPCVRSWVSFQSLRPLCSYSPLGSTQRTLFPPKPQGRYLKGKSHTQLGSLSHILRAPEHLSDPSGSSSVSVTPPTPRSCYTISSLDLKLTCLKRPPRAWYLWSTEETVKYQTVICRPPCHLLQSIFSHLLRQSRLSCATSELRVIVSQSFALRGLQITVVK